MSEDNHLYVANQGFFTRSLLDLKNNPVMLVPMAAAYIPSFILGFMVALISNLGARGSRVSSSDSPEGLAVNIIGIFFGIAAEFLFFCMAGQLIQGEPVRLWRGGRARLRRFPQFLAVYAVQFLVIAVVAAIFVVLSLGFDSTGFVIMMILMGLTILGVAIFLQFARFEAAMNWQSGTKKCLRVSVATVRSHFLSVLGVVLILVLLAIAPIVAWIALSLENNIWLSTISMMIFVTIYYSYSQLVMARVFSQWRVDPDLKSDSVPRGEFEELSESV